MPQMAVYRLILTKLNKNLLMKDFLLLVLALLGATWLPAQVEETPSAATPPSPIAPLEDSLETLSQVFMMDSLQGNRIAACDRFVPLLVKALEEPNSFDYPFDSLRSISIQYPPDSSFRIFTWQLYVDTEDYRYFGAIQMNTPELKLYPLKDGSAQVEDPEFEILDPETWYGAVYYNLLPFETPEGTQYLLFGFDGYQFFDKRKIVEVLRFRDGAPVFGAPVFATIEEGRGPITQNRLIREYSAAAAIRCNFDPEHNLILLDHMATVQRLDGNGLSLIPDGTYEGYRYKDGLWVYEEKLFHVILESAPRPKPVFNQKKKKDLFGN